MKNKGFTLVELIGVLTLIGIIALIAIPTVDSLTKKSRLKMYERAKQTLITSTRSWLSDNKELFSSNGDEIIVTLLDLKEQGYIEFNFKNPLSGNCVSNKTTIVVTKVEDENHNTFDIDLVDELLDGTVTDCEAVSITPSIYLKGKNPIDVKIGETFVDPGAIAKDSDGNDISNRIVVTGTISTVKPSKNNHLLYSISSNGVVKSISRIVNVIDDEKPIITGAVDKSIDITVTSIDFLSGVSVTDNSGEQLTIKLNTNVKYGVVGNYYATYIATDSSGNTASVEIKINIHN